MNNIQEAQLLRENRAALVEQLNDLGFADVNDATPLSEMADYMRWAGGLRDLRLATINKSTGAYADYSEAEWNAMSASGKASCLKLGIRIRAERLDFIISKENVLRSTGASDIPWCASYADVKGLTNYGDGSTGHLKDIDGEANTDLIIAHGKANDIRFEAAEQARAYKAFTVADGGLDDSTKWSLPAIGQLWLLYKYRKEINAAITAFLGPAYIISDSVYWSSTEYSSSNAWLVNMYYGGVYHNNKSGSYRVRAVAPVPVVPSSSATTPAVYDIPLSSVIEAWIDCERNKRSANSCIKFRWHAARDLVALWREMRAGRYKPGASMVFMATSPVMREIWAGAFRDRVVHHWEALRYGEPLEHYFIDVGDMSMNCRPGYGALRAVETFRKAIYDFTEGYTRDDCYIVGGDFKQFFPSINKELAVMLMEQLLMDNYTKPDLSTLIHFLNITIRHRPQSNYFCISPKEMWDNYPATKSLFHSDGFAPGNLISQHVANLVGAVFTAWMVYARKAPGFIIFVDDWRCLVRSKEEGRRLIEEAKTFLHDELSITLHPDKVYLQHYKKGTKFVGAVIKPGRTYITNRTRGHFIDAVRRFNAMPEAQTHAGRVGLLEQFRASVNSYLGMMCHFNSFKVRRKICRTYILPVWSEYLYFVDDFTKCVIKKRYDKRLMIRKKLRSHKYAAKFIRPKWTPPSEE